MQEESATTLRMAVCADPPKDMALLKAAARLAVDLNLQLLEKPVKSGHDLLLVATADHLELRCLTGGKELTAGKAVYAELEKIEVKSAAGRSLDQPLIKAIGFKKRSEPPTVIDATAGWGEDGYLMAALGCRVLMVERNKVMHMLLRDAVLRAGLADPALLGRITMVQADAKHLLRRLARGGEALQEQVEEALPGEWSHFVKPEVVYLDPMFPGAQERKTAERKPMKVLRNLVGDDADALELWQWAMRVACKRVVVKRPLKAAPLGAEPTVMHKGKSLRYDVYAAGSGMK